MLPLAVKDQGRASFLSRCFKLVGHERRERKVMHERVLNPWANQVKDRAHNLKASIQRANIVRENDLLT